MSDGWITGTHARPGVGDGHRHPQGVVVRWGRRAGTVALVAVLLVAGPGCSVILRALGIPVGSAAPQSPLAAGTYLGLAECEVLVQVQGGSTVPDVVVVSLNVVVDERGQPQRNGIAYETGESANLEIGRFDLQLTVTGLIANSDTFVVNMDAVVVIDAGTVFAFEMSGEAAETFTQESDGTMTYALSVNLVERDETGATLDRSMAVQCAVVLERK